MNAVAPSVPSADLLVRVAERTMRWNFRMWGFGEAIALRGLLEAADLLGRPEYVGYVHGLLRGWMGRGVAKTNDDHVAPGRELVTFHRLTADRAFLDAARAMADLHVRMPEGGQGARCHRPDQPGWRHQIWVDCMDVDGPFLVSLAAALGDDGLHDRAADEILGYARTLQQDDGLFRHGHERYAGRNGELWARGQDWALMGLVDTLAGLPAGHRARAEIGERLHALLRAIERHQRPDGLWHTVVDRTDTYHETTLAAMVAAALPPAFEHGLVEEEPFDELYRKALAGTLAHVDEDGALRLVSDATPVGEHATYATRPFGVFPWGQGPLLLALTRRSA